MKTKRVFYIFLLAFLISLTNGFCSKVDSLKAVINKTKNDTVIWETLVEIGKYYEFSNFDTTLHYYELSASLAQNKKLFKQQSTSLRLMAIAMLRQGDYSEATRNLNESVKISKNIDDHNGIASSYNALGVIYNRQSEFEKAIDYFLKSIDYLESTNDKNSLSRSYNNLGLVFRSQGRYDSAIDYFLKSLALAEQLKDTSIILVCLNNIGIIHNAQASYNKALDYYLKALFISEKRNDIIAIIGLNNNIGTIYNSRGQYEEALYHFNKALEIALDIDDKKSTADLYNNIGRLYKAKANYSDALKYFKKTLAFAHDVDDKYTIAFANDNLADLYLAIADSISYDTIKRFKYLQNAIDFGLTSLNHATEIEAIAIKIESTKTLMKAYKMLGEYEKAINYAELHIISRDSVFSEEKTKAIAEAEKKFETEKKQLTIENLEKEKKLNELEMLRQIELASRQKTTIFFTFFGLLIISTLSLTLSKKLKVTRKQKAIIESKNIEVEEKNYLLTEQNDEIRTQRDEIEAQRDMIYKQKLFIEDQKNRITDSINYAQRIQEAILPDISNSTSKAKQQLKIETFVLYKPKDIVSGDFYWKAQLNGKQVFAVADCTGHGVPGALMSMLGVSFLNEIVSRNEVLTANHILNQLRDNVKATLKQTGKDNETRDGMDIALIIIDFENSTLQFAGAYNPLFLLRNNELIEYKADRNPIGIHYKEMLSFTNHTFSFEPNDTLYLFSDGYPDQIGGENNEKYKRNRLKKLLQSIYLKPLYEQKDILEKTFENWKGMNEQIDDVTVMGIRL